VILLQRVTVCLIRVVFTAGNIFRNFYRAIRSQRTRLANDKNLRRQIILVQPSSKFLGALLIFERLRITPQSYSEPSLLIIYNQPKTKMRLNKLYLWINLFRVQYFQFFVITTGYTIVYVVMYLGLYYHKKKCFKMKINNRLNLMITVVIKLWT